MNNYIIETIKHQTNEQINDVPWLMGNEERFTVKSTWDLIRKKLEKEEGLCNTPKVRACS